MILLVELHDCRRYVRIRQPIQTWLRQLKMTRRCLTVCICNNGITQRVIPWCRNIINKSQPDQAGIVHLSDDRLWR